MSKVVQYVPPGFEFELNTIAIDFDGVIHNWDKGWVDGTLYGEPIPGSIEAIKELSKKFRLVLWTAKAKKNRPLINGKTGIHLIHEWLKKYDIDKCFADITSDKPRARLYIDDNAYRFDNWKNTLNFIEKKL